MMRDEHGYALGSSFSFSFFSSGMFAIRLHSDGAHGTVVVAPALLPIYCCSLFFWFGVGVGAGLASCAH